MTAPIACSVSTPAIAKQRELRPGHDRHADQADEDRAPAIDAHPSLAEKQRGEDHRDQRHGIAKRDRFRQRQMQQAVSRGPSR